MLLSPSQEFRSSRPLISCESSSLC
jgi:hypothetical protein